jgi:glycosyltransferase involved in cell wall biosynthesis
MKVSVITPVFNCAAYLEGCIASIRAQTHPDLEHIVVDGGSTDGTLEILRGHSHLVWTSGHDAGMYDAINKGIHMSQGEVLAYLNADDRYYPNSVELAVKAFRCDQDLDFVYGDCQYVDQLGGKLFRLRPLPYSLARRARRMVWPQPTCFWRKRAHARVGFFDATMRNCGDYDFFCRLLQVGKGCRLRACMALFTVRPDCLSVQGAQKYLREKAEVMRRYGLEKWSPGRFVAEVIYALINIASYPQRLRMRSLLWRRKKPSLAVR